MKSKNKPDKYLEQLKQFDEVKSEKDYWKKHKVLKKAIGGIYKNIKRFISDPKNLINKFEAILNEAVRIKLLTPEYKKEKMKKLLDELSKPSQFKQKAIEKINKAKSKFKKKSKKKSKTKKNISIKQHSNKNKKRIQERINITKNKIKKKLDDSKSNKKDNK